MLSLDASESSAGAPRIHDGFTPEPQLERHLQRARHDERYRHWLFGALLVGKVYVADFELLLGHDGPMIELRPHEDGAGRVLAVYTSLARVPGQIDADDVETMPFAELLQTLESGVDLCLNPDGPQAHRIAAEELDLLRRVLGS
ncbi:MAG: SseB family protein [Nannocystaceae bacterium]